MNGYCLTEENINKVERLIFTRNIRNLFVENNFECSSINEFYDTFYLPEASTLVQIVSDIKKVDLSIYKYNLINYLIIDIYKNGSFIDNLDTWEDFAYKAYDISCTYIVNCSKCKKKTFVNNEGSFECRYCHNQNGDHDLKGSLEDLLKGLD